MLQFFLAIAFLFSFGAALYLIARSLPRIEDDGHSLEARPSFLDRWATSELPERIDAILNTSLLKFLRKAKVVVLKIDNKITLWLQRVKPENGNNDPKTTGFKELVKDSTSEKAAS